MERNLDMLYLVMVVVFLIASILLLFWNRGRERIRTEQMHDSGTVTLKKSHLPTRRPKIKKQSNIDASLENKIQVKMWYYSIDGNSKHGPITEEELRRLLSSRRLLPDTLVWTQKLPHWSEASSFKNLMTSQES
ncbi:MAG: GYF domain-containing protein [Syntrophus sp. (in: bacteria)]